MSKFGNSLLPELLLVHLVKLKFVRDLRDFQIEQFYLQNLVAFVANLLESLNGFWVDEEGLHAKVFEYFSKFLRLFSINFCWTQNDSFQRTSVFF